MAFAILTWNPRKLQRRTHLDHKPSQPRLFPVPNHEKFYEPPSHVIIWDFHPSGTVVILAQHPTFIPDVNLRASFVRHKQGKNPNWEARMLARYTYRKSEEGKLTYNRFKGEGILV